jgi:hypothetical protein
MATVVFANPGAAANAAAPKTFLQQCVKEQAPGHLYELQSNSTLWQAAAVATYVAYIVLTLAGVATAVVFAPIFLPVITITSLFLLQYARKVHDLFDQKSEEADARAMQLKKISDELKRLTFATPQKLQEILQQKGIATMVPNPRELKPLIARHNFWEKHILMLKERRQATLAEAAKLSTKSYGDNKEKIFNLRCAALELEKASLEATIKNAFINAVIRRPQFAGKLEDLGSFSQASGQERAIDKASEVPDMNPFFRFQNQQLAPITFEEVKKLAVSDLAMRFVQSM